MSHPPVSIQSPVGLVLGGGAARGWAHIGVIRALEEAGVRPAYVAGCSMGALVGAAYAAGALDRLEAFARGLTTRKVVGYMDPVLPMRGLLGGEVIDTLFDDLLGDRELTDLAVPFCAVASDLATGKEVRLCGGPLAMAVRASCALPGVFTPVVHDGRYLVDGGLVNPVPVDVARDMGAKTVIAVDLSHDVVACGWCAELERQLQGIPEGPLKAAPGANGGAYPNGQPGPGATWAERARRWLFKTSRPNVFDVIGASINIVEANLIRLRLANQPADLLVRPALGHMDLWDFANAANAIEAGRAATNKALAGQVLLQARVAAD